MQKKIKIAPPSISVKDKLRKRNKNFDPFEDPR